MPIFVGVPFLERVISGSDLNKAGTCLDQAAGQEATPSELAGVVFRETILGLERNIKGSSGFLIAEYAISVAHGAKE